MDQVWIIYGQTGEYADRCDWVAKIVSSEEKAVLWTDRLNRCALQYGLHPDSPNGWTIWEEYLDGSTFTSEDAFKGDPWGDPNAIIYQDVDYFWRGPYEITE